MEKKIILIDADQCLIDFNQGIANIYEKLYGEQPPIKDPYAFKALNKYDFSHLSQEENQRLKDACSGENCWKNLPAMPGAIEFINKHKADFDFIVLTSMPPAYEEFRRQNLRDLGIEFKEVFAVQRIGDTNPKEEKARETKAVFFIDDLVKNFQDIHDVPTKMIFLDHKYTDGANDKRDGIRIDYVKNSFEDISNDIITPYLQKLILEECQKSTNKKTLSI